MTSPGLALRRLIVLACIVIAWPVGAAAQPPPAWPRVEVWVAAGAAAWSDEGRIDSDYMPETALFVGATRATQTLTLDPTIGRGIEGGINVFPWQHLGLQAYLGYARADLSGVNGPYELDLSFISRQPPNYDPVPITLNWSLGWPDTLGRVEQWSFGGGLVARTRAARVGASVAAGLGIHRVSGTAEQLGLTVFHLGGHSTLFSDDFRLRVALEPTIMAAAYVGGDVDIEVAPHFALTAGARAFFGAEHDVPVLTEAVVERNGSFEPPALSAIDARLGPPSAQFSPAGFRVFAGIKIR